MLVCLQDGAAADEPGVLLLRPANAGPDPAAA